MNLTEIRETYYAAATKASDVARQLAFAGIAVVWLLSGASVTPGESLDIEDALLLPGFFLVASLTLDLLHAAYRAAAWGMYGTYRERHRRTGDEDVPSSINYPSLTFFWGKLIALGIAYALLASYLVDRLS